MDEQISFKTRVRDTLVSCAKMYYSYYVCRDYLVISDAFSQRPYYIISAEKDNFLHLTGVSTSLSGRAFFDRCLDGSLSEDDFELSTYGQDERASKGTIRRKMNSLPYISGLLSGGSLVEEGFQKNTVYCSLASSDGSCTMGFVAVPVGRPKTLLKGNELNPAKSEKLKIVLSKARTESRYSTVEVGNDEALLQNYSILEPIVDEGLATHLRELKAVEDQIESATSKDETAASEKSAATEESVASEESAVSEGMLASDDSATSEEVSHE